MDKTMKSREDVEALLARKNHTDILAYLKEFDYSFEMNDDTQNTYRFHQKTKINHAPNSIEIGGYGIFMIWRDAYSGHIHRIDGPAVIVIPNISHPMFREYEYYILGNRFNKEEHYIMYLKDYHPFEYMEYILKKEH